MQKISFQQVDDACQRWKELQPFPAAIVRAAHEQWILDWVYNSAALSGSQLDLRQTRLAQSGVMIGGKSLQETADVVNQKKAVNYIEEWLQVSTKKESELSEKRIQELYKIFCKTPGKRLHVQYRQEAIINSGLGYAGIDAPAIPKAMKVLVSDYTRECRSESSHPLLRAAMLHCGFLFISPFAGYNARIARCLLVWELLKNKYPPIVIPAADKQRYRELSLKAVQGSNKDFIDYISNLVLLRLQAQITQLSKLRQGFF